MTERICQFCGGDLDMMGHRDRCPTRGETLAHIDDMCKCGHCGKWAPRKAPRCACKKNPPEPPKGKRR